MNNEVKSEVDGLKSLGSQGTTYQYEGADANLLEAFPNPMNQFGQKARTEIEIVAPEFTSLCPKTGQPDFATIVVKYMPNEKCVESKSWKLYLGSFRNAKDFHETCVTKIALDLIKLLDPIYLYVEGQFTPRGGIKFWPSVEYYREVGDCPDDGGEELQGTFQFNPDKCSDAMKAALDAVAEMPTDLNAA